MGTFPLSLVPFNTAGIWANYTWAPEPVFTLDEATQRAGGGILV
jgi:hypothetical protein